MSDKNKQDERRDEQAQDRRVTNDRRVANDRRRSKEERRGAPQRRAGIDRRSGLDRRRGPGRRRGEVRKQAEEGEISGDLLEFVMTVDEYKRINKRPYPTISELFEIVHYLGYRKVAERADHINIRSSEDE